MKWLFYINLEPPLRSQLDPASNIKNGKCLAILGLFSDNVLSKNKFE